MWSDQWKSLQFTEMSSMLYVEWMNLYRWRNIHERLRQVNNLSYTVGLIKLIRQFIRTTKKLTINSFRNLPTKSDFNERFPRARDSLDIVKLLINLKRHLNMKDTGILFIEYPPENLIAAERELSISLKLDQPTELLTRH